MYSDPLHVSYQDLCVMYDGKEILMLNKRLLDQQNAWLNLEDIKETHWLKYVIYNLIAEESNVLLLRSYAQDLEQIEYRLQELWGFEEDSMFHKFWEYPKCSCPKIDNKNVYPRFKIQNLSCLLHGF